MKKIVLIFAFIFAGNVSATNNVQQMIAQDDCYTYASGIALDWGYTPGTDAYNDLYYRMYNDCANN